VRRRGTHRRSIWILVSLVALAAALVPTSASALASTSYSLQSSPFTITGSPYAWSFSASRLGTTGAWSFTMNARRTAHNGKATQTHSWGFSLPAADITISANLATVNINTHTDLQGTVDYGSVNLHFIQKSKLRTVSTKCKKTNKVLFSSSRRTGKLGGTFDFKPNAGSGMPIDVKKAPIGVSVTRFVDFHRSCPSGGGGGGGGGGGCATGKSFGGQILGPPFFSVSAAPIGKTSFLSFSQFASGPTISPATNISHSITVSGPASAVVIGATGNATINGAVGTPFLSATKLTYKGGTKTTFTFGKCKNIVYTDSWHAGSLNVKFDSGAVLLDSTHLLDQANTTRIVKA
jgi:hypothetical protein